MEVNVKEEKHDKIERELQECFKGVVKEGGEGNAYIIARRGDCFLNKVTENEKILEKLQSCWKVINRIEDKTEKYSLVGGSKITCNKGDILLLFFEFVDKLKSKKETELNNTNNDCERKLKELFDKADEVLNEYGMLKKDIDAVLEEIDNILIVETIKEDVKEEIEKKKEEEPKEEEKKEEETIEEKPIEESKEDEKVKAEENEKKPTEEIEEKNEDTEGSKEKPITEELNEESKEEEPTKRQDEEVVEEEKVEKKEKGKDKEELGIKEKEKKDEKNEKTKEEAKQEDKKEVKEESNEESKEEEEEAEKNDGKPTEEKKEPKKEEKKKGSNGKDEYSKKHKKSKQIEETSQETESAKMNNTLNLLEPQMGENKIRQTVTLTQDLQNSPMFQSKQGTSRLTNRSKLRNAQSFTFNKRTEQEDVIKPLEQQPQTMPNPITTEGQVNIEQPTVQQNESKKDKVEKGGTRKKDKASQTKMASDDSDNQQGKVDNKKKKDKKKQNTQKTSIKKHKNSRNKSKVPHATKKEKNQPQQPPKQDKRKKEKPKDLKSALEVVKSEAEFINYCLKFGTKDLISEIYNNEEELTDNATKKFGQDDKFSIIYNKDKPTIIKVGEKEAISISGDDKGGIYIENSNVDAKNTDITYCLHIKSDNNKEIIAYKKKYDNYIGFSVGIQLKGDKIKFDQQAKIYNPNSLSTKENKEDLKIIANSISNNVDNFYKGLSVQNKDSYIKNLKEQIKEFVQQEKEEKEEEERQKKEEAKRREKEETERKKKEKEEKKEKK